MRNKYSIGFVLLCAACSAQANDEYVNATFCYRIVLPTKATNIIAGPDDHSLSMDVGGRCDVLSCIRLGIFAVSSNAAAAEVLRAYHDFAGVGWKQASILKKEQGVITWSGQRMRQGDRVLDIYHGGASGSPDRFYVAVSYGKATGALGEKAMHGILSSWRFLSECV